MWVSVPVRMANQNFAFMGFAPFTLQGIMSSIPRQQHKHCQSWSHSGLQVWGCNNTEQKHVCLKCKQMVVNCVWGTKS